MPPRIDALLFDLGRVLIDIDMTRAHTRWAAHAGVGPETFDFFGVVLFDHVAENLHSLLLRFADDLFR